MARVLLSVGEGAADDKVTAVTGGEDAALGVAMPGPGGAVTEIAVVKAVSAACLTTARAASTTAGFRKAIVPETMLRLGGDLNDSRAQSVH